LAIRKAKWEASVGLHSAHRKTVGDQTLTERLSTICVQWKINFFEKLIAQLSFSRTAHQKIGHMGCTVYWAFKNVTNHSADVIGPIYDNQSNLLWCQLSEQCGVNKCPN